MCDFLKELLTLEKDFIVTVYPFYGLKLGKGDDNYVDPGKWKSHHTK